MSPIEPINETETTQQTSGGTDMSGGCGKFPGEEYETSEFNDLVDIAFDEGMADRFQDANRRQTRKTPYLASF